MPIIVRRAESSDLPGIREIYNHAIRELPATFDIEEKSLADREAWFAQHGVRYPILVAVDGETVVGWASLSPYSDRLAAARSLETSVYLHCAHTGRGIGTLLMAALVDAARELGYHLLTARIVGDNAASIRLHEKFGFTKVGMLHEIAWKFDRWHDMLIMERIL